MKKPPKHVKFNVEVNNLEDCLNETNLALSHSDNSATERPQNEFGPRGMHNLRVHISNIPD